MIFQSIAYHVNDECVILKAERSYILTRGSSQYLHIEYESNFEKPGSQYNKFLKLFIL